jgi:hypothetical protein
LLRLYSAFVGRPGDEDNSARAEDEDTEHVKRLEQFMLDRGYRRDRHAFWRMRSDEDKLAIQYDEDDEG